MSRLALILLALSTVSGCAASQSQTVNKLKKVEAEVVDLKERIAAASALASQVVTVLHEGSAVAETIVEEVKDARASAVQDEQALTKAQGDYKSLKSNPWVKAALFIRFWFYTILFSYVAVGIVSGILFGRGIAVGLVTHVLDFLPLANVFKLIGNLFAPKRKF